MCRQVANLSASLSVEDLHEADVNTGNFLSDNAHTRVSDNALSGPASYVMTPASPIIRTTTGRPTSPSIIRPVHSVSSVIGDKATEVKIKDIDPNIEKESKKHGSFGSKIGSFFKSKDSINKSKDSLNNKK